MVILSIRFFSLRMVLVCPKGASAGVTLIKLSWYRWLLRYATKALGVALLAYGTLFDA